MRNIRFSAFPLLTVGAFLCALGTQAAFAQTYPSQGVPSYAQPNNELTIKGRIAAIKGTFNISVDDDNGYVDNVQLHQGTVINPTGLTLEVGMRVTIMGTNGGNVFQANEIDTPYGSYGYPLPVYYGPRYPAYYGYSPYRVFIGGTFFWGPYWHHGRYYYGPRYHGHWHH